MTSKVLLFPLIILFALVFIPYANALNITVGDITIKGTDTYYDASLSGVTIKTNKVTITDLFLFNQDVILQKDFSRVSIPTDAIPIQNLFISNADAIRTKNLGSATAQPPIVSFTYSPSNPVVNQSVTFNASTSYAPAGTIVKYEWDFGDGSDAAGITVTHSYSKIGDYNVFLTVTDDKGATNTASKVIKVCSDTQKTTLPYESIQSDGFGHHIKFQLFGPDTVNRDSSVNYVARIESVRSDGTSAQRIIMRGNVYTSYEDDIIEIYPVSIKERWDGEWHDIDPVQDWNEGSIRDALCGELVSNAIPIPGLGILLALFTENPPEPGGSMFYNENQYDTMQIPFTPPTKWGSRYVPIVGHQPHPNAVEIQIPYKFASTGSHQIHFFMWAQAMAPSSPVNTSDFYINVDVI